MFQTAIVEKIKMHKSCSETFFLFENHAVYEMWNNVVEPGRVQTKIWRMRVVCCISKATNTLSEYVISISFPLKQWLHERATVFL
jgi:hypothetical protein